MNSTLLKAVSLTLMLGSGAAAAPLASSRSASAPGKSRFKARCSARLCSKLTLRSQYCGYCAPSSSSARVQ